jgi:GT2 family glycosyltransferase
MHAPDQPDNQTRTIARGLAATSPRSAWTVGGKDGDGPASEDRVSVAGKFLVLHGEKLPVRGVTYGTFSPDGEGGGGYPAPDEAAHDLLSMRANGVNAVRTYTVPPPWFLDLALQHHIRVMVGMAWEGHVAFLNAGRGRSIEGQVRQSVRACAGHPAILCYSIGNEVPASLVRWHGTRLMERFLQRLASAVKEEDPDGLVTYANYPTTEYLELPFLDVVSFNLFLESEKTFSAYLGRLQNLAAGRPLLLSEIGLDSARNGRERQADVLEAQLRAASDVGCAGTFVFSWTDEWHRGGHDIEDWDFGIVDRDRRPKPALRAVRDAYAELPRWNEARWPRVSVIICTYNGARTLDECLDGFDRLDYPDYEMLVVDDGSTDNSRSIAERRGHTVIGTGGRGLSAARNIGLAAATGEIVAYIDDDAWPDPHWLKHLVRTFASGDYKAVGGPNVPPPGGTFTAACVAASPGGPNHVLISDHEAEHVPGCNMAFRRQQLAEIGGFDETFRIAGDDVDVCWRIQEKGWTIGFSPGAVVLHRRRDSVRAYLRQQYEYGKAEGLLERKWPDRYNRSGHVSWVGRVYAPQRALSRRWRIYYGRWGTEAFQPAEVRTRGRLASLPLMPEWYLVILVLAAFAAIGLLWSPLLVAAVVLAASILALICDAAVSARRATAHAIRSKRRRAAGLSLVFALHVLQPAARLAGRIRKGLAPWRRSRGPRPILPICRKGAVWSETWRSPESWVALLQLRLLARGVSAFPGGVWDRWDLEVGGGLFGGVRLQVAVEEHGEGRQLVRWRYRPRPFRAAVAFAAALLGGSVVAALDGAELAAALLASWAIAAAWMITAHSAGAAGAARSAATSLAELDLVPTTNDRRDDHVSPHPLPPPLRGERTLALPPVLDDVGPEDSRVVRR